MQQIIKTVEAPYLKENPKNFSVGDTVKVYVRIVEGRIERTQVFEGVVLGFKNGGLRETFTVRKISFGVGVERVFPLHSPRVEKVEVVRFGKVRKAKLYYLRGRSGKAARVKELIGAKKKKASS